VLLGNLDSVSRGAVHGWAWDDAFPNSPVVLLIIAGEQLIQRVVANRSRPDVEQAGFGGGRFGFKVAINPPLSPDRPWLVRVCSEADGEDIPGSPVQLAPSTAFDDHARASFAAMLDSAASPAEVDERIAFLTQQRDRLLQLRLGPAVASTDGGRELRTLVIDDQGVPNPARDGGSGALVSHMRSLQRLGYAVTFAAPDMADGQAAAMLQAEGIEVCHAPWFTSVEEVLQRGGSRYAVVYLHRAATAASYLNLVRQYQPRARLIYSVADLHHVRLARQATLEDRPELMIEARRLRAHEVWAAQSADAVITHSTAEAAVLREVLPAPRIHVMAWSIPCRRVTTRFSRRRGMAFIGNYSHAPNLAALHELCTAIMPELLTTDPAIICKLVGANLPATSLADAANIRRVGHVADLHDLLETVRLTVAPLPFGAGLKAKVMVSLAAGVPCLCSPAAAEGMELPDTLQRMVVTDAPAMRAAIRRLHADKDENAALAAAGLEFARAAFSEARLDELMRQATGAPSISAGACSPAG
jgi:glycosyltransferase involved in cell wall biosynthesis